MLNLSEYAGLLIFLFLGCALIGGIFLVSAIFRERSNDPLRKSIYECGMETIGTSFVSPNIRFYVYALLFVVFDVEAVFLLPWAVNVRSLGMPGLWAIIIFITILFVPFIYAWKKGALEWE